MGLGIFYFSFFCIGLLAIVNLFNALQQDYHMYDTSTIVCVMLHFTNTLVELCSLFIVITAAVSTNISTAVWLFLKLNKY